MILAKRVRATARRGDGGTPWRCVHSTPSLTIGDYRCRRCREGAGPEECSTCGSIAFPRSGVFVRHVRGEEVVGDANRVMFFNRGEVYRVSHPIDGGDDCTTFKVAPELLAEVVRSHDPASAETPERLLAFASAPSDSETYLAHRRLLQRLSEGPAEAMAVEEFALGLIDEVIGAAYRERGVPPPRVTPQTARARRDLAERVRIALAAAFRERLTLDGIARAAHSSPFHLSRVFREQTGLTVHRYLTRLRLRAALERLADGEPDLTRVALAVGFYDHSHFSNAFRREFGVQPSACRSPADLRDLRKNLQV